MKGTFQLAQFAADLRQVALDVARPEYGDPVQFFERTYITRGLRYLLAQALQRLNGVGGEPVIDLMTTFGCGKTHSEIAVYHLAGGASADSLLGVREICNELGMADLASGVRRAVIVGNDFSVLGTEKADGTVVKTMWGELAWQLGGKEGYARVARYDDNGVPPPTTELANLLSAYAPCVILIDEWVAYCASCTRTAPRTLTRAGRSTRTRRSRSRSLRRSRRSTPHCWSSPCPLRQRQGHGRWHR